MFAKIGYYKPLMSSRKNMRIKTVVLLCLFWAVIINVKAQNNKLLFSDDFNKPIKPNTWITEMEPAPNSGVYTQNGSMILNTRKGVTVWFNQLLKGNIRIEFDRTI